MLLLLALTVAIALFAIGCNDTNSENGGATSAPDVTTTGATTVGDEDSESNVRGEGNTEFVFKVVTASGETKTFTVRTDKTTVGEALLDVGLIKGENGQFGLYVTEVDGEYHKYEEDGMYWAFHVDGGYALKGVDSTEIVEGTEYSLKAAKG